MTIKWSISSDSFVELHVKIIRALQHNSVICKFVFYYEVCYKGAAQFGKASRSVAGLLC